MSDLVDRLIASLRGNWLLKLTALGLALLLWSVVRAEAPTRVTIPDVPLRVVMRDADWVIAAPPNPSTVSVVFSGPVRELVRLAVQRPELVVPIDEVRDSTEIHVLRTGWVAMQSGMDNTRAEDVLPSTARLVFDRVTTRILPLSMTVTGALPQGLELAGPIRLEPADVRASGAARRLDGLDALRLPPLDLGAVRGYDTLSVPIDTTGTGLLVSPRTVRVIVPVRRTPEEPDES